MKGYLPRKRTIILLLLSLLVSSGYSYKKVKAFVLVAPEQILPGVSRIAVLDFEGKKPFGETFSNYLITRLIDSDRGMHELKSGFLGMGSKKEGKTLQEGTNTNAFDIVERSRMMQVIEEQKLGLTGLLNQDQAVSLGQMLGVQAILMGNVVENHADNNFQEQRSYKQDGQRKTKMVNCRKRMVNATVSLRIISAESGQILGSTESTKSMEDKKCESQVNNLTPVNDMVNGCLQAISEAVSNYFSPHYELETYDLEKIETDPFKKIGDQAANDAENLDIDKAYIKYWSIYEKDPYNPKLLYNIGVMHEVVGNFQKANEFYEMAYQLKDEGRYEKAIQRIKKNVEYAEVLAQMGMEIQEHEFVVTKEKLARAAAKKVEIKGKREERFNIYAQPQQGSEVVTRVPGGVTFSVVKKEGDWFLLKLLGGKEGYIHKNDVKVK